MGLGPGTLELHYTYGTFTLLLILPSIQKNLINMTK